MDSNQELHILHRAIFGHELQESRDPEVILNKLKNGCSDIIVDLNWGEQREEEYHEKHKIVLQRIDGEKIIFFNPMGHSDELEEGDTIEGEEKGPVRRVEGTGLESITVQDFIRWFKERNAVSFLQKEDF